MDIIYHAERRRVSFSKVMSYGNALDISEYELLEHFTGDDESQIIAIYIEGVRDGERFYHLLKEAACKKPVAIYKGGISEAGLRAAQSHTAGMTSSVGIFEAVCRQVNAIRVNDIAEMVDALVTLRLARLTLPGAESPSSVWAAAQASGPAIAWNRRDSIFRRFRWMCTGSRAKYSPKPAPSSPILLTRPTSCSPISCIRL
ncbi:MAG: hypothetical protein JXA41_02965 [Deltaproteobacteria bacterium]|nr:hypothetical protein [Deltaproteobacteria bacterium]